MKKRMKIMRLLDRYSTKEKAPTVKIIGNASGLTLYEGSMFDVPYGLCHDYVKDYVYLDDCSLLRITMTCSPY